MEPDGGVAVLVEFLEHRLRDALVDAAVALPRLHRGRLGELGHAVLGEPQRRVGDFGVEAAEVVGIMCNEPEPEGRAVAAVLLEGGARLRGDGAILVGQRVRDPGDVVQRDERRERGDQPAAAAPDRAAVPVAGVAERTSVGDDDQPPAHERSLTAPAPRPANPPGGS